MQLIWNWRDAWKWASVQVAAVSGALQLAIIGFPDTLRNYLPDWVTHWVALFCFGAIVLARITATTGQTNAPP